MKKRLTIAILIICLAAGFAVPVLAQQTEDVERNDFQLAPLKCAKDIDSGLCGFVDLILLVERIMRYMIFISASLAVIAFCYAGFLYITAFGNSGQVEKAHGIFGKVVVGLIFVFAAWLIIATILKTMGVDGAFSLIDFSGVEKFQTK